MNLWSDLCRSNNRLYFSGPADSLIFRLLRKRNPRLASQRETGLNLLGNPQVELFHIKRKGKFIASSWSNTKKKEIASFFFGKNMYIWCLSGTNIFIK